MLQCLKRSQSRRLKRRTSMQQQQEESLQQAAPGLVYRHHKSRQALKEAPLLLRIEVGVFFSEGHGQA